MITRNTQLFHKKDILNVLLSHYSIGHSDSLLPLAIAFDIKDEFVEGCKNIEAECRESPNLYYLSNYSYYDNK